MTRPDISRPWRARLATLCVTLSLALCLCLFASPGQAQLGFGALTGSGSGDAAAEESAESGEGSGDGSGGETGSADVAADPAAALLKVLEDPEARDKLIGALRESGAAAEAGAQPSGREEASTEPAAAAPGSEDTGADASAAASNSEGLSIGRQAAELSQRAVEQAADFAFSLWDKLALAPGRLSELRSAADSGVILGALQELAVAILVTYAVFIALRLAARPLRRRLGQAGEGRGWLPTLGLSMGTTLLDAVTVLAAFASGYAIVTFATGAAGQVGFSQSLYLNAFVAVEISRTVIRFALRPETGALRLFPLPDGGAQALAWRLVAAAGILGYGHLLAAPIVSREVGWRAGAALGAAVSLIVVLIAMISVLRHRKAVAAWLTPSDSQSRKVFATLARLWHIPVMLYLAGLFVIVLIRPGGVLFPVLEATAEVLAAIVVGMIVNHTLATWARRGVSLPDRITSSLPLLEQRLNSFLPKLLMLVRMLVLISILIWTLQVAGITQLDAWLGSDLGLRLTGGMVSVAMILFAAFVAWLAMTSWIDWRLNPEVGAAPSPRETTLLTLMRNAATIVLAVLTLMFSLSELGIDIAPLIASAGVLGLAIGFGAQKLVQDVITGIFIQLENAMNVGDVVTAGGITGGVEKLTVRSVSIRDLNGTYHLIPFSSVDSVSNLTRDFSYAVFDMGIAYREDIDEAKQGILDAFSELMEDPEFAVQTTGDLEWFGVQALGDSAVVLRARVKTLPGKQWGLLRTLNERVKKVYDARGIEIPYPHQTIYFGENKDGSAPALHLVRDDSEKAAEEMAKAISPRVVEGTATPAPAAAAKPATGTATGTGTGAGAGGDGDASAPRTDKASGVARDMPDEDEA